MPLLESFSSRLKEAEKKHKNGGRQVTSLRIETNEAAQNCFGTALYLTGVRDTENAVFLDLDDSPNNPIDFDSFPLIETPQVGCLLLVRTNLRIIHAAVVTNLEPLEITHRPGTNEAVKRDEKLSDYLGDSCSHKIEYRLPPKIEESDEDSATFAWSIDI